MIRNKEFKRMARWFFLLSLLLGVGVSFLSPLAAAGVLLSAAVLFFLVWRFIRRQYEDIRTLSRYLERISSGSYELDIRDNEEGELSILKNDIYKVTLTLREQAELLRKDKLLLADAISDISHQLKTPLTSLVMMTDLLSEPTLSEEKRVEFTRNIHMQLERMEWLLTALLKLSKIDAGAIRFRREPVRVETLLHQAAAPLLVPMDLKEQTLEIKGDVEGTFLGDLNWSTEALVNILKNCVEHTPPHGTITMTATQNQIYTSIVIEDTGAGIDPDDLHHVFERFYKGKNSGEESVGIGLAMAKSIITSQDGTIDVKSEAGKGARFEVKWYQGVV